MNAVISLRMVHADVERRTNAALYRIGLTLPQYTVLKSLENGDEKSMRDIAREVGMTPQTIHSVTSCLIGEQLVLRIFRTGAGRRIPMVLTDDGRNALADAEKIMADMDAYTVELIGQTAAGALADAAKYVPEPTN